MHAFILIGGNKEEVAQKVAQLAGSYHLLKFDVAKISGVREIKSYANLNLGPAAFVLSGLGTASIEAQNALLKILEEPLGEKLFILIAPTISNVLPTIVSRTQVFKLAAQKHDTSDLVGSEFLALNTGARFTEIDKHKNREDAKRLVLAVITTLRNRILTDQDALTSAKRLSHALESYKFLDQNANVALVLTNLSIDL